MTYLELVTFALDRAGVREDAPTTIVGATGIVKDFANWVADSWEELQFERVSPTWWFRTARDQTVTLTPGVDEYEFPTGLESIDWNTVTAYTVTNQDESYVRYVPYKRWRLLYDTRGTDEARPCHISPDPDGGGFFVNPVPDKAYTLRFDAVREIHELDPSNDADEPLGLPKQYHKLLAWSAIRKYAKHHEDSTKLMDADESWKKYYKRLLSRQLSDIRTEKGRLYK